MARFLFTWIVSSIVLILVLNIVMRAFPGTSADMRVRQVFGEEPARPDEMPVAEEADRLRVDFPWGQALLWSSATSLLVNVIRLLT